MEIRNSYVFIKDGVTGITNGQVPEGAEIIETRAVLYPAEDMELMNKVTGERYSAVWLHNGDTQENYIEVEIEEQGEENENNN